MSCFRRRAQILSVFLILGCAKPRSAPYTSADLDPILTISFSSSVFCNAFIQRTGTTTGVDLDPTDLISCNGVVMPALGNGQYAVSLPYTSNKLYTINVFRAVDGSTFSNSAKAP